MAKTDISMWYTMVFFYSTMTSLRQISLGGLRVRLRETGSLKEIPITSLYGMKLLLMDSIFFKAMLFYKKCVTFNYLI